LQDSVHEIWLRARFQNVEKHDGELFVRGVLNKYLSISTSGYPANRGNERLAALRIVVDGDLDSWAPGLQEVFEGVADNALEQEPFKKDGSTQVDESPDHKGNENPQHNSRDNDQRVKAESRNQKETEKKQSSGQEIVGATHRAGGNWLKIHESESELALFECFALESSVGRINRTRPGCWSAREEGQKKWVRPFAPTPCAGFTRQLSIRTPRRYHDSRAA
jgi:hypothetical protein